MSGRRTIRRPFKDEAGMTLPELLISMVVASLILTAFLTIMVGVQKDIIHQQNRTQTNDEARQAIEQIDRELRSGTVLYDPINERNASNVLISYYGLRFETQANAPTRGGRTCVQYRIENNRLLRRSWPTGNEVAATGWWVVAEGLQNVTQSVHAFEFTTDTSQGYNSPLGPRVVNIVLLVNAKTTDSATSRITSSIAIRNQSVGDPCTPVPSG
ncbi:MAG: type II secretion system protein J [Actinomycetota bacterium]